MTDDIDTVFGLLPKDGHYLAREEEAHRWHRRYVCSCGFVINVSVNKDGQANYWSKEYWQNHLDNLDMDRDESIEVATLQRGKSQVKFIVATVWHPLADRMQESYRKAWVLSQREANETTGYVGPQWMVYRESSWGNRLSTSVSDWGATKEKAIDAARDRIDREVRRGNLVPVSGYTPKNPLGSSLTVVQSTTIKAVAASLLERADTLTKGRNRATPKLVLELERFDEELREAETTLELVRIKRAAVQEKITKVKKNLVP